MPGPVLRGMSDKPAGHPINFRAQQTQSASLYRPSLGDPRAHLIQGRGHFGIPAAVEFGGGLGLGEGFVYESRGKVDLRQLPMRLVPVRSDQNCCSQIVFGLAEVITNGNYPGY